MRTPGQDRELAAGFLYTEGVIRDSDDIDEVVEPAEMMPEGIPFV